MAVNPPAPLSPEERERRLGLASQQYMRGEITVEAFEEAERQYAPDYRTAMLTLARRRRASENAERDRPLKRFAHRQIKKLAHY